MAGPAKVQVEGLRELRTALKDVPRKTRAVLPRELTKVAEMVAVDARNRVPNAGTGRRGKKSPPGRVRASITAKGTSSYAAIVAGGSETPYYKWLDFGSRDPRYGNNREEGPWRGSGPGPHGGRIVYPAIEAKRSEIIEAAGEAVDIAAREAGFR